MNTTRAVLETGRPFCIGERDRDLSPYAPPRPCRKPGCPGLTTDKSGYCEVHRQEVNRKYDRQRGTASQRGYDRRWRKYRDLYLLDNPLCVDCKRQGRLTPATVVDHITPHKGDAELFWDSANHQALCKLCHDRKTAKTDGRWGIG